MMRALSLSPAGNERLRASDCSCGALRPEHCLEVHQATAVALTRQLGRVGRSVGGAGLAHQPEPIVALRDQGILDIFQGQQHCCDVGKLRLFQRGLLRIHLRKRGTAVTNRQVHAAQSVRTTDSEWVSAPSVRALRPSEPPMAKPGCRAARA